MRLLAALTLSAICILGGVAAAPPDGAGLSFVFVERMPTMKDEAGRPMQFAVYLAVQGRDPDDGSVSVVVAAVSDHTLGNDIAYGLDGQRFYCRTGKVGPHLAGYYSTNNRLVEQSQDPPDADDSRPPGLDTAFAIACGTRKVEGLPLPGVAAIRADAKSRFLSEPVK